KEEYAAAGIPTMAARVSAARLKTAIVLYIIIFTWELSLLYWGGLAGAAYLGLVLILGLYWLSTTLTRWRLPDAAWGRSVFLASLITLLVFCLALSTAPLLP
ncbi:MAG: hypothetical protein ACRDV0_10810, partial [Acidimicrobiales bacterium]